MTIETDGRTGPTLTRRGLLETFGALGTLFVVNPLRSVAHFCRMTVNADEGPFYPTVPIPEHDDLTFVADTASRAAGTAIYLYGTVVSPDCRPVPGSRVEIWQADAGGQYVHPRSPVVKPLDPNFRYFAATRSDAEGFFRFRTIHPAPYSVMGLLRAPHIHIRVKSPGHATLTTELYFAGAEDEARRREDRIFKSRGERRNEMIVAGRPARDVGPELRITTSGDEPCFQYDLSLSCAG